MTTQSEQILENNVVHQLSLNGYEKVVLMSQLIEDTEEYKKGLLQQMFC